MYLYIEKDKIIEEIDKKKKENRLIKKMLVEVKEKLEDIKQYKTITKRTVDKIKEIYYNYYTIEYGSPRLVLYLDQKDRIYKTIKEDENGIGGSVYFENQMTTLYIDKEKTNTQGIIEEIENEIDRKDTEYCLLENDNNNINEIIKKAEELQKMYNNFENYTYTVKKAINFTK